MAAPKTTERARKEGERLTENVRVTVLGNCFRREEKYEGLRRLLSFRMREVVALGDKEHVDAHLAEFGERIAAFLGALGLPFKKEAATDPFYDRGGQRALLQKLSPVKHEFIVDDLAIASLNIHRNAPDWVMLAQKWADRWVGNGLT